MVKENVWITIFNVNGNLLDVESIHTQAIMINCVENWVYAACGYTSSSCNLEAT
jgi:hypothetical protein